MVMKTLIFIFLCLFGSSVFSQDTEPRVSGSMSGRSGQMNCPAPVPLTGPTRSGAVNNNVFARYRHLIPGVNTFTMPTRPLPGNILSDTTAPKSSHPKTKNVDEYIKEYNSRPDNEKGDLKNIFHENWTMERFNNSPGAIYRTMKYLDE